MKILFFIDSLRSGGKERRLVELIKGLAKFSEFEMELVLAKKVIHYTDIFFTNVKIHYALRREGLKKDPRVFFEFFKITKRFNPDIIHVWTNLVAVYSIPSKLILKIPIINNQITNSTVQKSKSILGHWLTFPFSDKIIANTYAGLKAYNVPEYKSCVIYNGFDFNRIEDIKEASSIRSKFNIKTKSVVGMVATFNEKKDYKTYIESANLVLKINRDITFLCIGSGDSSNFEKLVEKENKDKILFLGEQKNIESIMNICDIGVLMTNNEKHGEGISNAILEFFALGKPVIATLGGGNAEIINNGVNGYLIKDKSIKDLVEKITLLITNRKKSLELGKDAKNNIENNFNINKMIFEFRSEYENLINK